MINNIQKKDVCCIIITYNPTDTLVKLFNIINKQVSHVIIVDNFSRSNEYNIIQDLTKFSSLNIIRNDSNYGIAKALNQGVDLAINLGFKWAITFDQDTIPFHDIVETLVNVYNNYPNKNLIGAIGVNAIDVNNIVYYKSKNINDIIVKEYLITSGSLLSLNIFNDIGRFCEDLFIDNVDIDYSIRLKLNGKISLFTKKCGMLHKPGSSISKFIFGINIESANHNSIRKYYMSRNNFILTKKYILKIPLFILKMNLHYVISLIKMILVERNIRKKIKSTIKGIYDGITYKQLN